MDLGRVELVRFLGLREPFARLAPEELGELAAHTEVEFYPSGAAILTEDGGPVTFLRVIQAGAVSIVHDGRLLDLLGVGDSFGHDAMLAGMAPGFEAVAAEDTLCYRIPAAAARPLLERARGRELADASRDPGQRAVANLIRSPTVLCDPEETIGAVARRMTEAGAAAAIVELPRGARAGAGGTGYSAHLGIVTDRDLRCRVVAAGLASEERIAAVMTTPVFTVTPDRLGAEVMFELLERGIHHAPVLTATGRIVGVIEDSDLFAVRQRSWFGVRRAIDRAADAHALRAAASQITPTVADLHAASLGALQVARVLSALTDAALIRALQLSSAQPPPGRFVWLALSSHARRELTPASTAIGALVCEQPPPGPWIAATSKLLAAAGSPQAITARTAEQWLAAGPEDVQAVAVLNDRRVLFGELAEPLPEAREAHVARLRAQAAAAGPPTGFDGVGVLSADGASSSIVDIRQAAVAPVQALARWAGACVGESGGSTPERLVAAAAGGVLETADAAALTDAFTAAFELRVTHQMNQLAAGERPDDLVQEASLSRFARHQLREVFRTVAAVRRRVL